MSKPLYLFGNWKMYLDYQESVSLARAIVDAGRKSSANLTTVIFPSALSVQAVAQALVESPVGVGAQNIAVADKGGYTGEVSAAMYKAIGAKYALIGHSERRHLFHETNHEIRQKVEMALVAGLIPVVCVGETLTERNDGQAAQVVEAEVRSVFSELEYLPGSTFFIAYEPVWAVNTGVTCSATEADQMHSLIRRFVGELAPDIKLVVLYGGSVKPDNVAGFCAMSEIDGVLVGGASVKHETWQQLVETLSL
jgi:triosephosphate isomerase